MIVNPERLIQHLTDWIKEYAKSNGKTALIIKDFELYDSDLVIWLCKKTRIPVITTDCTEFYEECSEVAEANNGIIVETYSLSDMFLRSYKKSQIGDILPLGDLHLTEVQELYRHADINHTHIEFFDIKKWTPIDIEWATKQDDVYNIISDEKDPVRHREWGRYSTGQREMIAEMHQIEKKTRHKVNPNIPICHVRDKKGLVR